jgi:hypothetical protein
MRSRGGINWEFNSNQNSNACLTQRAAGHAEKIQIQIEAHGNYLSVPYFFLCGLCGSLRETSII